MTNAEIHHQTALAFFEAFKRLPDEVRTELKKMIGSGVKKASVFQNDTAYLLRNETSRASLKKSIDNVNTKTNLVSYSPDEWADFTRKTLENLSK